MPVSSFAPEFLEIFKTAAQEKITIPLNDNKRAMHLRFRLNMLRKAMRIEKHSLTTIANSVQFSISLDGDLICSPTDSSFLEEIKKAGVVIPLLKTDSPLLKPERAEEVLKKFLKPEKE